MNKLEQDLLYDVTIREYFAARAPAEPQKWFKPAMPPAPEPIWEGADGVIYPSAAAAERTVGDVFNTNQEAMNEWEADYVKQKHIQWPWAWADAVLEAASTRGDE